MASRDRSKIQRSLAKKGFVKEDGGRHEVFTLEVDGRAVGISTIISRGSSYKVYGDPLMSAMANQLQLSVKELCQLVDCPLSEKEYVRKLARDGRIRP